MGLNFNRFSVKFPTVGKCDFDFKFYNTGGNQKLKDWSFQLRKNYFCILNIERSTAHQGSVHFFFIHPVQLECILTSTWN